MAIRTVVGAGRPHHDYHHGLRDRRSRQIPDGQRAAAAAAMVHSVWLWSRPGSIRLPLPDSLDLPHPLRGRRDAAGRQRHLLPVARRPAVLFLRVHAPPRAHVADSSELVHETDRVLHAPGRHRHHSRLDRPRRSQGGRTTRRELRDGRSTGIAPDGPGGPPRVRSAACSTSPPRLECRSCRCGSRCRVPGSCRPGIANACRSRSPRFTVRFGKPISVGEGTFKKR